MTGAYLFYQNAHQPAPIWFATKSPTKKLIDFPKDDGPHDTRMEWWYFDGHIQTPEERVFSYHYVVFIVGGVIKPMVTHLSLTDHQTGKHYIQQRSVNAAQVLEERQGFDFAFGDWRIAGGNGKDELKAVTPEFALDLRLETPASPVLHGGTGLLDLGPAGSTYYYSRTRMRTEGSLTYGGRAHAVSGESWFDHQWGEFDTTRIGWYWFALQLTDGSDLMIYQFIGQNGEMALNTATLVHNGQTEYFQDGEFNATPVAVWTSPATGIRYPLNWRIIVPSRNMDLRIAPVNESSEFDSRKTTYNVYWEGAVRVTGSHAGVGFLEVSPNGLKGMVKRP